MGLAVRELFALGAGGNVKAFKLLHQNEKAGLRGRRLFVLRRKPSCAAAWPDALPHIKPLHTRLQQRLKEEGEKKKCLCFHSPVQAWFQLSSFRPLWYPAVWVSQLTCVNQLPEYPCHPLGAWTDLGWNISWPSSTCFFTLGVCSFCRTLWNQSGADLTGALSAHEKTFVKSGRAIHKTHIGAYFLQSVAVTKQTFFP